MPDEPLQPAQVAALLGVDVGTVRRWCAWHGSHLSGSANPPPGGRRRLTLHDVEVLRAVKELRDQGLQTTAINERLYSLTIPDAIAQEGQGDEITGALDESSRVLLQSLTAAFLRSQNERERLHGFVLGLAVGVMGAAVFFLIIVLLAR